MNANDNRMTRLEEQRPPLERTFIGWAGNPWTPAQAAEAIRRNPEQQIFRRALFEAGEPRGEAVPDAEARGAVPGATIVTLNYQPHAAQLEIHRARGKRFRTVCTGRRFGKTLCLAAEILDRAESGDYGWVAPTYNVAERGIEAFRAIGSGYVQECGRAPSRAEFAGASGRARVWFLSADNPDNIRGFGFRGLVVDEAATMPPDVWQYVLRPTIAQTLGWAMLVSTPSGRNWFYDLFARGQDPAEKDHASFTFPSRASPFFPDTEWEEAQRTLGANVFRQEFQAEFLEDAAGVFAGVDGCLTAQAQLPDADCARRAVVGCDVAKHADFTVLIAMDANSGRCLAMERFNHLDWTIQKERIVAFSRRWGGRLILDATGVGDPIYDDLRGVLPEIEAYRMTALNKTQLIQRLAHAVEERKVTWPAGSGPTADCRLPTASGWEVLTAEMKRFEYEIRPGGGISYGAPSGYHDDCVIALALANHRRCETPQRVGNMLRLPSAMRTPSDGGYESQGGCRKTWFGRRPRVFDGA
jgi:hypothetical protein